MTFIWPMMLVALVLIPLGIALYLSLQRRRRGLAARYGSLGFVQGASGRPLGWRRHVPPGLFLVGLTLLAIALARPQTVVSLPKVEGTVILAFDVSGSMAADDLKPTRMEAAKAAARIFVEKQPLTMEIGVVAFSDGGIAVQAPTNDQAAILAAINRLAPARGTSVGSGILSALQVIATANGRERTNYYSNATPVPLPTPTPFAPGTYAPAAIILLTDGENNARPDPMEAVQVAIDRGIRIYTVGIGSPMGATIQIEGFNVHTQLDEATLKEIAQASGAAYFNAQNEKELQGIYQNIGSQFVIEPQQTEVTSIFAGVSLLMLLIGGILSLLLFSRLP